MRIRIHTGNLELHRPKDKPARPPTTAHHTHLQVTHQHHVPGAVEIIVDGLEEDRAQHGSRLGALIPVLVDLAAEGVHEPLAVCLHDKVCRHFESGLAHRCDHLGIELIFILERVLVLHCSRQFQYGPSWTPGGCHVPFGIQTIQWLRIVSGVTQCKDGLLAQATLIVTQLEGADARISPMPAVSPIGDTQAAARILLLFQCRETAL